MEARAALCLLLLTLLPHTARAATDRQTRTFPLPVTRALSLEITIGTVRIEASTQAEAALEIVRHAPDTEGFARIPVTVDESETEVRIRALQIDGQTDPAYRTDVTLRVPRAARLTGIRVMEGRLELAGLAGTVTADIRRGPITGADVEGTLRLETGIGSIVLDRARLSPAGLLRLRAFNGDVKLSLAERPADARVLALALNGTIASEIPLTMKDTWGPRWGETTLGKGEPVISIDVVTGTIEIKSP